LFLRHIQLEIADKFVFVTSKFNQKSQWNIKKLIHQLDQKPDKKISNTNRLIVVHNFLDVEDEETLKSRIQEVEFCYNPHYEGTWKNMKTTVYVDNKPQEHVYYQTDITIHLFMVKHPREEYATDWRYLRNMSVVAVLQQLLLTINPRRFNLFKEFLTASDLLMSRYQYLKGWDDTYCVKFKEDSGHKLFLPCRKKPQNSILLGIDRTKTEDITLHIEDGAPVEEIELNGLQITDVGEVITEGQSRLNGNVATTPLEHIIQIIVPGVNERGAFSFKFEGWHTVSVSVVLPFHLPISKQNEQTTKESFTRMEFRGGKSFFRHTFPESMPFRRPTNTDDLNDMISVEGGILTIHLPREYLEKQIKGI